MIRILMAEDHTILRESLGQILGGEPNLRVIGQVEDGAQAVEAVGRLDPDLVLMDIGMHGLNGLEATRRIRQDHPDVRVIILTQYTVEEYVQQAFANGASGYLVKSSAIKDLVKAIGRVMAGELFISPVIPDEIARRVLARIQDGDDQDPLGRLTRRERDIVVMVAEGLTSRQIGEALEISPKTVDVHRTNAMHKLDLHNVAELTRYALKRGLGYIE